MPDTPGSARTLQRLALGAAAVLPVALAADPLPIADDEARRWLRDHGLVRNLAGREVVVWGDVLDALREGAPTPKGRTLVVPGPPRVFLAPPRGRGKG